MWLHLRKNNFFWGFFITTESTSVDMDVEIKGKIVRLVAYWSLKEKRHTYLITNLKRDEFSMQDISNIYRMRWQVEILFKECKSHNSLHGFNTQSATLQESLIWGSLIATTLTRFVSPTS
jgi:IS4 transposase